MPAGGRLGARRRTAKPESARADSSRRVRFAVIRAGGGAPSGPVRLEDVRHFGHYSPRYRAKRGCEVRALSRRAERRPVDGMRGSYSGVPDIDVNRTNYQD
jgi:hypothetical protein